LTESGVGIIDVEIEYTDVSWGIDLENLVSQILLSRVKRASFLSSFARAASIFYAPLLLLVGIGATYSGLEERKLAAKQHEIWLALQNSTSATLLEKISAKIDYIFDPSLSTLSFHELTPIYLQILCGVIAFASLIVLALRQRSSFLLLNEFTRNVREAQLRKHEFVKIGFGVSFVVGTIASVAASFIYNYLTK
jgi:hypothetical protein